MVKGKRKRITQVVEKGCKKEKKEKLKLQIEYLRHKTYKTKLEILKLEKEWLALIGIYPIYSHCG